MQKRMGVRRTKLDKISIWNKIGRETIQTQNRTKRQNKNNIGYKTTKSTNTDHCIHRYEFRQYCCIRQCWIIIQQTYEFRWFDVYEQIQTISSKMTISDNNVEQWQYRTTMWWLTLSTYLPPSWIYLQSVSGMDLVQSYARSCETSWSSEIENQLVGKIEHE